MDDVTEEGRKSLTVFGFANLSKRFRYYANWGMIRPCYRLLAGLKKISHLREILQEYLIYSVPKNEVFLKIVKYGLKKYAKMYQEQFHDEWVFGLYRMNGYLLQ